LITALAMNITVHRREAGQIGLSQAPRCGGNPLFLVDRSLAELAGQSGCR